jgi:Ca2+-binding RTX toxin-like protein
MNCEQLETRTLFASVWTPTFNNAGNDTITIGLATYSTGTFVYVSGNTTYQARRIADVSAVEIFAGYGNDNVKCAANFPLKVILHGESGNDTLAGGNNADTLYGDHGADSLMGGAGRDWIYAGHGNDVANGGASDDVIFGGYGHDVLCGDGAYETGHDVLIGEAGNDTLLGMSGDDWLSGGAHDDVIHGMGGHDRMWGGDGNDSLFGGAGRDIFQGGAGNDTLFANDGERDTLYLGGGGVDQVSGKDSFDVLSPAASPGGYI